MTISRSFRLSDEIMEALRTAAKQNHCSTTDVLLDCIRFRLRLYDEIPYKKTRFQRLDCEMKRIVQSIEADTQMLLNMCNSLGVNLDAPDDDEDLFSDESMARLDADFEQCCRDLDHYL